jgi:hypothetical protein
VPKQGSGPGKERGKKRKPRKGGKRYTKGALDDEEVPVFLEKCDCCDNMWASNIKFHNALVKGFKPIHRICQFCMAIMVQGPPGSAEHCAQNNARLAVEAAQTAAGGSVEGAPEAG